MATPPSKHGKRWTSDELSKLQQMVKENTPTRLIALKMQRTPDAVAGKASKEHISLKPTNQSPYNRRKS
ncbi:MAG: hypothetical protein ORN21_00355 [Methylophilaceae bacterium]|nr:hypothetical protein [Methylophilaceae bacterium]